MVKLLTLFVVFCLSHMHMYRLTCPHSHLLRRSSSCSRQWRNRMDSIWLSFQLRKTCTFMKGDEHKAAGHTHACTTCWDCGLHIDLYLWGLAPLGSLISYSRETWPSMALIQNFENITIKAIQKLHGRNQLKKMHIESLDSRLFIKDLKTFRLTLFCTEKSGHVVPDLSAEYLRLGLGN